MGREKIRHLFNKNHIEIIKIENPEIPIWKWPVYEHIIANLYVHTRFGYGDDVKREYKVVRKKSPLGFYYNSKVKVNKIGENYDGSVARTIVTFPVPKEENTYYQLKYVTEYDDNKIGKEDGLRPWDIYPGDKNFSDNMLSGLLKEVTDFFNVAEYAGIKKFTKNPYSYRYSQYTGSRNTSENLDVVRQEVFTELFGNPNGPRFQTDADKILAHGFDLKYSFRKDKEQK